VIAYIEGELGTEGSDEGMVMDFGDVSDILGRVVHDKYDHHFIVWEQDEELIRALGITPEISPDGRKLFLFHTLFGVVVVPFVPTAENLAQAIFNDLAVEFELPTRLVYVKVWETPKSMAVYPA
jgi:6-pyruvoyltetrahydropterin/6-carboxytetrahydropterin synthase